MVVSPDNWAARARDKKARHHVRVRDSNSVLHKVSSKNHHRDNSSNVLPRANNRTGLPVRVNSVHPSKDKVVDSNSARASSSVLRVSNSPRARVATSKKAAIHQGYRKKTRNREEQVKFEVFLPAIGLPKVGSWKFEVL